jgi:hypothetical protein
MTTKRRRAAIIATVMAAFVTAATSTIGATIVSAVTYYP